MIRKTIAGLTAAATLAAPIALAVPANAINSKPTIADVLLSDMAGDKNGFDNNWYDFDVVTQAVLAFPDLTQAASDPNAALTVFAPNDRAFQVLVKELTGKWQPTEAATFQELVDAVGLDTVKNVLLYHIIGAKIPASAALEADGAVLDTLLPGSTIEVDVVSKRFQLIVLKDADKNDFNPWIVRSKFNVGGELANGYIHGLGLVLRPADLP